MNELRLLKFLEKLDEDVSIIICVDIFKDTWLASRKFNNDSDDHTIYDDHIIYRGKYDNLKAHQILRIINAYIVEIGIVSFENDDQSYIFLSIRYSNGNEVEI